MDYFLIFNYSNRIEPINNRHLDRLQIELVNLNKPDQWQEMSKQYNDLSNDEAFGWAIFDILKIINEKTQQFKNVQLVCENEQFLTENLPEQFKTRNMNIPYVFTNIAEWKTKSIEKYGIINPSIPDLAAHLGLIGINDSKQTFKMILKRLQDEKVLENCDDAFIKASKAKTYNEEFSYFRVLGLPFQISKNQIINKVIEPARFGIKNYGLSLIFENGRFSGKAVIKLPSKFDQMVLSKDRMFIGRRYIEIIQINQVEYTSYKVWEQKQREERMKVVNNAQNSSSKSRSRSRDNNRQSSSRSGHRQGQRQEYNRESREVLHLLNESAIKIRGLPFSLNNWDIEQIFKQFNFVRGSVKLGFMGERKSGQAVILFPNKEEAERALVLHNLVVGGRYLELRLINKEFYDRFH